MPDVYHHRLRVSPAEIDAQGHANNVAYLHWMQEAALAHSDVQGWPREAYKTLGSGWVVRTHSIEYLRPAFEGEEIVVRTWVSNLKRATSLRKYEIRRGSDGKVLAAAQTDWVFVSYATGTPQRIPPEVASCFTIVESPPDFAP
jgi:acyl-CoA thioester hydrolase